MYSFKGICAKLKNMASILIKDTTKQERECIVAEALGNDYGISCGSDYSGIDYQLYIDGKVELKDLNAKAKCGFEVAYPDEYPGHSCMI